MCIWSYQLIKFILVCNSKYINLDLSRHTEIYGFLKFKTALQNSKQVVYIYHKAIKYLGLFILKLTRRINLT